MVHDPLSTETESLGQFLRKHRIEKGIDIQGAAEETRIPPTTLKAIEDGNYDALPADAFARGFYSIYARLLSLDCNNVLERYTQERNASLKHQKKILLTPSRLGKKVGPMAERPVLTPLSVLGFSLVVLIVVLIVISWSFSWNPANFISKQLRSFGKQAAVEQTSDTGTSARPPATAESQPGDAQSSAVAVNAKYTLLAEFQEPTKVTVTIDGEFPEELAFAAGQTHTWYAKESIILSLPAAAKARLTLNGVIIPLPAPVDGYITVPIPPPSP